MKRKTLTLAISVFALLAIISVGFASWVISRGTDEANVAGSISVDTVEDKDLGLSAKWVDVSGTDAADPIITYGVFERENNDDFSMETNEWLKTDTTKKENLIAYLKISVENIDALADKEISVTLTPIPGTNTVFDTKNNGSLFVLPTVEPTALTSDKFASGSVIIKLEFKWGSTFNGVNPLAKTAPWAGKYDSAKATIARNALVDLEEALKDVRYTVVVSAQTK